MKTSLISGGNIGAANAEQAQKVAAPVSLCRQRLAGPEAHTNDLTMLKPNHFTTSESSRGMESDNLNRSPCATAKAARERFQAQHGPGAGLARQQATPKEVRKALLAAEMARWESF